MHLTHTQRNTHRFNQMAHRQKHFYDFMIYIVLLGLGGAMCSTACQSSGCVVVLQCLTWWDGGWRSRVLHSGPFHKEASSSCHRVRRELQGDRAASTPHGRGQAQATECPDVIVMYTGAVEYLGTNDDLRAEWITQRHTVSVKNPSSPPGLSPLSHVITLRSS